MKKLLFIALLLTACTLAFTGCKKSSENPSSVSKSQITGKWFYVKIVEDGDTETFTDGEYIDFNENGTANDSMDNDNGQWSLSGNKLTIVSNNQTHVATVDKITNNELVISSTDHDKKRTLYLKR
ncbi:MULTISPECIES: lipocalin family protein [unclassified Mucilaginibacter]|uniref:lipocalin family protein n=1 Tax=unclassified Mucilaginibacter TaxID=2617802 RepID=UPI002AC98106|nr:MULTISPECIES: lipocalin family protein [unclassified Mucilaginibacter]MEB0263309.1 lipocalin family protein [Mucilaginibacter sp. 10I4]MEB0278284.1 lipocalin family protein [Mucilaginibacter sp. 10B2]MEB0301217.1 lipocalin family protein [Mucilaginibacter sp. 5C4]WPX23930.1 lipocalin family protein [Mucilaginibacter sp. 5C4]